MDIITIINKPLAWLLLWSSCCLAANWWFNWSLLLFSCFWGITVICGFTCRFKPSGWFKLDDEQPAACCWLATGCLVTGIFEILIEDYLWSTGESFFIVFIFVDFNKTCYVTKSLTLEKINLENTFNKYLRILISIV